MTQIPDKDNFRNSEFNGLDWTEASRLHKNVKRLGQTLPDELRTKSKKNKIAIKCSNCNREFKTVNGILPVHHAYYHWQYTTMSERKLCKDGTAIKINKSSKPHQLKQVDINDIIYNIGDAVLVEKRNTMIVPVNMIPKRPIIKAIISKIVKYENYTVIYFDTGEIDRWERPIEHIADITEFTKYGLEIIKN